MNVVTELANRDLPWFFGPRLARWLPSLAARVPTGWPRNGPGRGVPHEPQPPARRLTGRWSCSSRHELVRREMVETRMRPHFVVPPPSFDGHLCFGAGGEPLEAQALVAELAVKLSVTPFCQPCRGSINAVPMPCATIQDTLKRHLQPCHPPQPMACRRRARHAHQFFARLPSSPRSRTLARQPASSAAHSRSSCFSRRTSLAPAEDRLFADPVPLGHRQHQLAIRLAQEFHYLSFRETRCAHCSLRIASQSLT